jgi:hypothetical protein
MVPASENLTAEQRGNGNEDDGKRFSFF